jgi:NADH dehydrogenase FAD-containing subunit
MAGINDFVREALAFYPRLDESLVRMVLVHAGPELLPELGDALGAYARKKLGERGVEIRTGVHVKAVTGDEVLLDDGTRIASRFVVWTAGTSPHPLLGHLSERIFCPRFELWVSPSVGPPDRFCFTSAIRNSRMLAPSSEALTASTPC